MISEFGKVFRIHPNTLEDDAKAHLYSSSVATDSIDVFVSHSWSSPGFQKYFSLMIYECGKPAIFAAAATGLLVLILQVYVHKLPYLVVEGAFDPIFKVYQESQP